MRTAAVGGLLIWGTLLRLGQTSREPYTVFKEFIGLQDDQFADIQHGKAVTKVPATKTPSEIVALGCLH